MELFKHLRLEAVNHGAYSGYIYHSDLNAARIQSLNPVNNTPLAEISPCTVDDYQAIMTHASDAFLAWRVVPAPLRGDIIRQIAIKLRQYKEFLGDLIVLEMGKSKQEAYGEVQEMIDIADFAVGQSRMLYGKTMHSERPKHRMYEQWHPYGIVGVISAFNFPVAVWAWNAFIAAICGNVVVWKPSSSVALCAIAVHKICSEVLRANNSPAIFSLFIPLDHKIATEFVSDKRIPLISFTGSSNVGRKVATIVAQRLACSILELGGNNAIIIDETANIDLAIQSVVFGAVGTAGQRCTSTRRLFVHHTILDDVLLKLKCAYQKVTVGPPSDCQNIMGPLISPDAVVLFQKAVQRIKNLGGKIVFGGEVLNCAGNFVQPTLVTDLDNHCDIVQEETFAPLLYVMPYKTLEEAVVLQNSVPQGLSSALFTENIKNAEYYLSVTGSDCGIANINIGTSGAEIGGAFGGEKDTGGGREAGSDAWKFYMRRQTTTINWGDTLPLAQGIDFSY